MTKKQSIQPLLFLCGFVLLFSLISFPFKSARSKAAGPYWQYFFQTMPADSHDIVFMGDSHAKCSFMPEVIDDVLGTESVVLTTGGSGIYQKYYEFKEIIKKDPNALIVLETNGIFGGITQDDLRPWSFSFFDSMPIGVGKLDYLINYSSPSNYAEYMFPLLTYHREWKLPDMVLSRSIDAFSEGTTSVLSNKGYRKLLTPLSSYDFERLDYKRQNPPEKDCGVVDIPSRFETLDRMVASLSQINGELILMKAPVIIDRHKPCEEDLLTYSTENNVEYSLLMDRNSYSRLWFADEVHTTTFGALYVTLEAIPILSENLEHNINQLQYDYYRSYLFKDLSKNFDGSAITLSLIPEDELLSKDLLYKWEVKQNDSVIKSTDYQNEAFINFGKSTDSPVLYEVHVWINNPDGDFVLEGVFEFTQ